MILNYKPKLKIIRNDFKLQAPLSLPAADPSPQSFFKSAHPTTIDPPSPPPQLLRSQPLHARTFALPAKFFFCPVIRSALASEAKKAFYASSSRTLKVRKGVRSPMR